MAGFAEVDDGFSTNGVVSIHSLEPRVFELTNIERIQNGRSPLNWTEQAAAVARYHSTKMETFDVLGDEGRDWCQIGENIAWISGRENPAKGVVECWMRSPGHRLSILNPNFREWGIGLALATDGKFYFTQEFGGGSVWISL